MDTLFFHLVPRAAAAAWRTAVMVWRWLIAPQLCLPPVPRDENMRGLGWAGDRRDIRPWLVHHNNGRD